MARPAAKSAQRRVLRPAAAILRQKRAQAAPPCTGTAASNDPVSAAWTASPTSSSTTCACRPDGACRRGGTVTFLPASKGHNVESKLVPDGAEAFKSELDEKYSVKLDKEGVYIYVCPPHSMMNMVGVIQVGEATNMDAVNSRVPKLEKRAMSNKGRLSKYIEQRKGDSTGKPAAATATESPRSDSRIPTCLRRQQSGSTI